ncbi:ABC transporter ATP-binding protein [Solidesulfovibrio sp.]
MPHHASDLLRFCGVGFGYGGPGGPLVLSDVSLDVAGGGFVCLLGPSGCGKTTLLNLAAGFLMPTTGQVLFQGEPVAGPGPARAVVFQEPTLFPWLTVLGNVGYGLRRQGRRGEALRRSAMAALAAVGLAEAAGVRPFALSGGMRQRAALARVLALDPPLLLLDEPFSALDLPTREHLQDVLLGVWDGGRRTVLYVTHSVEEAAYLGGRILCFVPGCARPQFDLPVDLPRPRSRSGAAVRQLEERLRELLRRAAA